MPNMHRKTCKDIYATTIVKSSSITLCPFLQDRSIFPCKISKDALHSFPEALNTRVSGIPQLNLLMTETLLSGLSLKLGSKYIKETYRPMIIQLLFSAAIDKTAFASAVVIFTFAACTYTTIKPIGLKRQYMVST